MENIIPTFLVDLLNKEYETNVVKCICDGYMQKRYTTFRINMNKTSVDEVCRKIDELNIKYTKVKWNKEAILLNENMEKALEKIKLYQNGEIYIQSLSSMIPPIVLDPKPRDNILDMCAAPGGKTTEIAALSDNKAFITACERNPIRAEKLKYNIEKQGTKGTTVMVKDSRDLDDCLKFDKILLDAPCSGSGTLYIENQNSCESFTKELIEKSIKRQTSLIKKAIKLLKPEGELVYSTCSILKEENEDIVNQILNNDVKIIPVILDDSIPLLPTTIKGTICIMPNKIYEGFFVAKIKKLR